MKRLLSAGALLFLACAAGLRAAPPAMPGPDEARRQAAAAQEALRAKDYARAESLLRPLLRAPLDDRTRGDAATLLAWALLAQGKPDEIPSLTPAVARRDSGPRFDPRFNQLAEEAATRALADGRGTLAVSLDAIQVPTSEVVAYVDGRLSELERLRLRLANRKPPPTAAILADLDNEIARLASLLPEVQSWAERRDERRLALLGRAFLQEGRAVEASAALMEAAAKAQEPANASALHREAVAATLAGGDSEEARRLALQHFRSFPQSPDNAALALRVARHLIEKGASADALAWADALGQQTLAGWPPSATRLLRAEALAAGGRHPEALEELAAAAQDRLAPDAQIQAALLKAESLMAMGRPEAAVAALRPFLNTPSAGHEQDAVQAQARLAGAAARAAAAAGKHRLAASIAETAGLAGAEAAPPADHGASLLEEARLLAEQQQPAAALVRLQAIVSQPASLSSHGAEALRLAATLHERLENWRDAFCLWQELALLFPDSPQAAEARKACNRILARPGVPPAAAPPA